MKKQNITVPSVPGPGIFIAYVGNDAKEVTVKLASGLRQEGIGVIEAIGGKSLKAQLRLANTKGVHHTIIIGDEEVKAGTVVLRDMASARQETVPITRLPELLKPLNQNIT